MAQVRAFSPHSFSVLGSAPASMSRRARLSCPSRAVIIRAVESFGVRALMSAPFSISRRAMSIVSREGGVMQRAPLLVAPVHVGAALEQPAHDLDISAPGRQLQGTLAIAVHEVHIGAAFVEKAHDFQVARSTRRSSGRCRNGRRRSPAAAPPPAISSRQWCCPPRRRHRTRAAWAAARPPRRGAAAGRRKRQPGKCNAGITRLSWCIYSKIWLWKF